jgi:hypothetical protein
MMRAPRFVAVSTWLKSEGEAILIRSPTGKTAPIDVWRSREIVSQWKRLGVPSIDLPAPLGEPPPGDLLPDGVLVKVGDQGLRQED